MALFRRAQDDEARAAVDRTVDALRECQRSGWEEVPVADVLRLLGADSEAGRPPMAQYLEPGTDPLTGCKSAAAPDPVSPARP